MLANSKASPIPGLLDTTLSLYPQPPWSAAVIHPLPHCLSVAHVMADVTHSRLCAEHQVYGALPDLPLGLVPPTPYAHTAQHFSVVSSKPLHSCIRHTAFPVRNLTSR